MTKFCPECGTKQRDDNNHYCPNCGFDFSSLEKDSNLNWAGSEKDLNLDNSSVDVPIEPLDKEDSKFAADPKSSVASSDSSASSSSKVSASSSSPRSSTKKPSTSSAKVSSSSTTRTKDYSSKSSKNNLLSNLTFNKCFLAFAILLILLVIIGMISDASQTEPYSDHGLTSFMYESNNYDLDSFLEDSNSYYDSDDDSNYLSYDNYDVSTILKN